MELVIGQRYQHGWQRGILIGAQEKGLIFFCEGKNTLVPIQELEPATCCGCGKESEEVWCQKCQVEWENARLKKKMRRRSRESDKEDL